jgi:hypothetical protein
MERGDILPCLREPPICPNPRIVSPIRHPQNPCILRPNMCYPSLYIWISQDFRIKSYVPLSSCPCLMHVPAISSTFIWSTLPYSGEQKAYKLSSFLACNFLHPLVTSSLKHSPRHLGFVEHLCSFVRAKSHFSHAQATSQQKSTVFWYVTSCSQEET